MCCLNKKMKTFIIITISLVLFISGEVVSQECSDCVDYDRCPEARRVITDLKKQHDKTMKKLLEKAFCGMNYSEKPEKPMICCSSFEESIMSNHASLKLLPSLCGIMRPAGRMVNGEIAGPDEFPWMALILYNTPDGLKFQCGGSIINERHVLTAAHCVNERMVKVRVGEYNMSMAFECADDICETFEDIVIDRVFPHERYSGMPSANNDIALLRLAKSIDFSHTNVGAICLPITRELRTKTLKAKNATVAGWGTTEKQKLSDVLVKVVISVEDRKTCDDMYYRYLTKGEDEATSNKLCAGKSNKGTCTGDSGGPLMIPEVYNRRRRYIQYGVISYVFGPCGQNPELFTDVTKFVGWILNKMIF